ncbi:MAG: carbohydrate ABC transporter permease [Elusimicrobia bacterium HGW-Elusimicrobia-1]|jgi:ABC-type glycerol-3-phosphate transport system permease component|nr:MAG: carbohydrate ABC transporter permease [Elusimicrobia bacterium HGW-Elusimicrobia-1]
MTLITKTPELAKKTFLYVALAVGAVFVLFPFFWMILVALKPDEQVFALNFILQKPLLKNFVDIWTNPSYPFGRFFVNSLIVATSGGFFTALFCSLGGYVFAKKDFYFKEQIFWILLATMMIPGMMFLVPQFAIVTKLGWINTYSGMVVPHLANVFGIFLMRQYMETIPTSIIESAKIDGAGEWQIFWRLIVPLSMTIITMVFLLSFLFHWSNFLWHLVVNTPESDKLTLPIGLALFKGQYTSDWAKMMAASCFSIIPIALIFVVAQKFFIEGLTSGAVKE